MIELKDEVLMTFHDAAKALPGSRCGSPVNVSTVFRWAQKASQGVRLEAVRVGSRWYTSREALQRFADRLTAQALPEDEVRREPRTATKRQSDLEAVQKELKGLRL